MASTLFFSVGLHQATIVALELEKLYLGKSPDGVALRQCSEHESQYFENCREHGFTLKVKTEKDGLKRAASFAEFRNSDEIVVYAGLLDNEIGEQSGLFINDELYHEHRRFFHEWQRGGAIDAAKFIAHYLATGERLPKD